MTITMKNLFVIQYLTLIHISTTALLFHSEKKTTQNGTHG
jgi:hypothetical protein